jgi:hypothetical protein
LRSSRQAARWGATQGLQLKKRKAIALRFFSMRFSSALSERAAGTLEVVDGAVSNAYGWIVRFHRYAATNAKTHMAGSPNNVAIHGLAGGFVAELLLIAV